MSLPEVMLPEDIASLVQPANQRTTLLSKLSRAANILRYYRTSQLLQRAVRTVVPGVRTRSLQVLPSQETYRVRESARLKMRGLAEVRSVRSSLASQTLYEDMSRGKFTLLEQSCELGQPSELGIAIDWHARVKPQPSHLWRFQLHYHEYLLDLAVGSTAEDADNSNAWPVIWGIVADWIDGNPLEQAQRTDDAWHPYCLSRRLPVWAQLFSLSEPPEELRDKFLHSFASQAEVLSKRLEFDLGGNHLLENLTTLALAGAFLEGPRSDRWLDLATHHLRKQLPLQVLPHGEHYERAPMYHCQVLGNLLQVAYTAAGVRDDLADDCRQAASKMYGFLPAILHPDGEIPLFGDSCWGEAHSAGEINAWAELVGLGAAAETASPASVVGPYWTWRSENEALIFDAGPVGANTLPAHAHCDLLGFEASIAGQRWFVDSGLFDYNEGVMRDYCRSSAAHNVVTVEHQNCCDVWSRFRMGRRGRPTRLDHGQQGGFSWCQASHDGYRHLGVPELSRLMVMHTSGVWTCLEQAKSRKDSSRAGSSLIGRLHLAPEIQWQQLDSQQLVLTKDGIQRWLTVTSGVKLGLAEGWYCNRFGRRTRTQVITYQPEKSNSSACLFGWTLSPSVETAAAMTVVDPATGRVEIAIAGDTEVFRKQFSH